MASTFINNALCICLFIVYLTMPSVARDTQRQIVGCLMNNELERT
jgi:hypothetical protein